MGRVQRRRDRPDPDVEGLGDLAVFEIGEVPQEYDETLALGKACKLRPELVFSCRADGDDL
jgi:hypothetical protein